MKKELVTLIKRTNNNTLTTGLSIKPNIFKLDDAGRDMDAYGRMEISLTKSDSKDKSQTGSVIANLTFGECRIIARRLNDIDKAELLKQGNTDAKENSPAYTVQVRLRPCSGATPAQYLSEHPEGLQALKDCGNLLRENVKKEPEGKYTEANKQQIAAIRDAISLYESGNLVKQEGLITVLETPVRNKTKKNKSGKNLVYTSSITCSNGTVEVAVENRYAAIIKHDGAGQTFDLKNAEDYRKIAFTMDILQALEFFDSARAYIDWYEKSVRDSNERLIQDEEIKERDNWKSQQGTTPQQANQAFERADMDMLVIAKEMLKETNTNTTDVLNYFKVSKLEDISRSQLSELLDICERKKQKMSA